MVRSLPKSKKKGSSITNILVLLPTAKEAPKWHSVTAISLLKSQLHSLQSEYLMMLKNKLGFHRRYSHNITFEPRSFGRKGFLDLWIKGGLGTLEIIIQCLQMPDYALSIIMIAEHKRYVSTSIVTSQSTSSPYWRIFIYIFLKPSC